MYKLTECLRNIKVDDDLLAKIERAEDPRKEVDSLLREMHRETEAVRRVLLRQGLDVLPVAVPPESAADTKAQAVPESVPKQAPETVKSGTSQEQTGTNTGTPDATPAKKPVEKKAPPSKAELDRQEALLATRAEMAAAQPAIEQVAKASGLTVVDRNDHFVLQTANGSEIPVYIKGAVQPDAINWASWHNTFLARYRGDLKKAREEFRRITGGTLPALAGELPAWAKRNPVKVEALLKAGLVPKGAYEGGFAPRITLIDAKAQGLPALVETVAHEHGHWAADRFLTDPERQTLLNGLPGMKGASIDPKDGQAYGQFLEAVQSALEAHAKAKASGRTQGQQAQRDAVKPAVTRVLEKLWKQLYDLFRGFRQAGLPAGSSIETERVLEALRTGEVFGRKEGGGNGRGTEAASIGRAEDDSYGQGDESTTSNVPDDTGAAGTEQGQAGASAAKLHRFANGVTVRTKGESTTVYHENAYKDRVYVEKFDRTDEEGQRYQIIDERGARVAGSPVGSRMDALEWAREYQTPQRLRNEKYDASKKQGPFYQLDKPQDEAAQENPVQRLQNATRSPEAESFAKWQEQATELLANPLEREAILRDASRGEAIGPAGEVALRRMVTEAYIEATKSGSAPAFERMMQAAEARRAVGTSAARELGARRLDTSTPEGRQELILSTVTEMGTKWAQEMKRARSAKAKADVRRRWVNQVQKITRTMKSKYGVDLTDPDIGMTFTDLYSLGQLMDRIADAGAKIGFLGPNHSWSNLLSYLTVGNLLSLPSFIVNLTGYPIMGGFGALEGVGRAALAASKAKMNGGDTMAAILGPVQAARFAASAMMKGLTNGIAAIQTGHAQAEKVAKKVSTYKEPDRGSAPGRGYGRLIGLAAPFLEINRAMDEIAWTMAYSGALAMEASMAKSRGDTRSVEEIHDDPTPDMIERAAKSADWFTFKAEPETKVGMKAYKAVQTLRSADLFEKNSGYPIPNPLFFVLPFFSTIYNLTKTGLKISPPGAAISFAMAMKQWRDGAKSDKPSEVQEAQEKAVRSLVYAIIGMGLAGVAWGLKDDDGEDAIVGAGDLGSDAGEREVIDRTQKPRTAYGVDYSRWDPIGMPLAMHADFRDALRKIKAGKPVWPVMLDLGDKAFRAAIDRQFLQGISFLAKPEYDYETIQENGKPRQKGAMEKFGENVRDMVDPGRNYLSSYRSVTEDTAQKGGAGIITALAGTPRMPAYNLFGENEQVEGGLIRGKRREPGDKAQGWYDLLAKSNKASEGKDWNPQPPTSVINLGKRSIRLNPEQRNELARLMGTEYLSLLGDPARYRTRTPEEVLAWMNSTREVASKRARGQFIAANPGLVKP